MSSVVEETGVVQRQAQFSAAINQSNRKLTDVPEHVWQASAGCGEWSV